jgi:hypothetical protein
MALANLIGKKRLTRSLSVITTEGVFDVVYDGNGLGYEQVLVNGETAQKTISVWWYVPRFEFALGNKKAVVQVGVSPLLKIRRFSLSVEGETVYAE